MATTRGTLLDRDPAELVQAGARKIFRLILIGIALVVGLYVAFNSFEHVDQDKIMVIQYPTGSLHWYLNGGYHLQMFGKTEKFPKRSQYWFSAKNDQGTDVNQAIKVRFNDGGHGFLSGSVAWEMPSDAAHLTDLYQKYGTAHAIEQDLVRTVVEKSVYFTGPLMSSKESYAERRPDLLRFVEDQITNGVYQTETEQQQVIDPLTKEHRDISVVKIRQGGGRDLRQEPSPLAYFGVRTYNLSINGLEYDETVEKQIQSQQQATMQVQTAMANARRAEQDAITAAKSGEAEAAKSKWEQEVIKARVVTEGQQKLEVAQLDAQAAAQFKIAETLRGEGEAARRRAVMSADGALDKKLAAWVQVNQFYAEAVKDHPGDWVPKVVMGGDGGKSGGNAQGLIDLFTAKTAHDISLNLGLPQGSDK